MVLENKGKNFKEEEKEMKRAILEALEARYNAQIAEADATIKIYLENPVGIGEHPQFTEELDKLINVISTAGENIKTIHKHFGEHND